MKKKILKTSHPKKKTNIQKILTRSFVLLSALAIGIMSVTYAFRQYFQLRRTAAEELQRTSSDIADNIDLQINQMDNILLSVISSRDIRDTFSSYENVSGDSSYERNVLRQELAGLMTIEKGFDFSVRQLNLYNPEKGGYGVGNYNGDLSLDAPDQDWYNGALAAKGRLVFAQPAKDVQISQSANVDDDQYYFSLVRMFYNQLHIPAGFAEVKKYYGNVFSSVTRNETSYTPSIYVYDADGSQIYPLPEKKGKIFPYYNNLKKTGSRITNTVTGKNEYLFFTKSSSTGLSVVVAVDAWKFISPVIRSITLSLTILAILLVVCILISHFLSVRISNPIRHIYHFLQRTDKQQFEKLDMEDTGIREIDRLKNSVNEDIQAKQESTQTMMTLKEQELQAEMLALQSQMNPHFLYNSLSTIAEMAEEGKTEPVAQMCSDITSILRYISSNQEQRSSLEEELEHCDLYLSCMKMRFGDDLQYEFNIEDEMLDYQVPKLCIQLLVENAIKATTTQAPPWNIHINGHMEEDKWTITVQDNGPGFDPEVDRQLRHQMDYILETGILPSLKINGMGILNIFIRLYLLDGIPFVFDFGNRPEGGAFITIGGYYKNDKDQSLSHTAG